MNDNHIFNRNNIRIRYKGKDKAFINGTYFGIKRGVRLLSEYFNREMKLPEIEITLAENRKEYDLILSNRHGLKALKTPATRIAQPIDTNLLLLSPSAYESDSTYIFKKEEYIRLMIHEYTHIVIRLLSCETDAVPRWFEEGLAVYLSEQWLYEDEIVGPVYWGVKKNKIPTLRKILTNRIYYYLWGWTVVKYIEKHYGKKMILNIVNNCNQDNDVFDIVGEECCTVGKKWRKELRENINMYIPYRTYSAGQQHIGMEVG